MNYTPSKLWKTLPPDLPLRLKQCFHENKKTNKQPAQIFFRADDIGVPSKQFSQMITLFAKHQIPLSLAVVPSWLTSKRWQDILKLTADNEQLWCWHQHGRSHNNHQLKGKKGEFGSDRTEEEIRLDLSLGQIRLQNILQHRVTPLFTPPWNRCSKLTLKALKDMGFKAVSRSSGNNIAPPIGLPDYPVNIDLHTRKETDLETGWNNLFKEIQQAVTSGNCGFMLHHQRMNRNAYQFLDVLLALIQKSSGFELLNLANMIK